MRVNLTSIWIVFILLYQLLRDYTSQKFNTVTIDILYCATFPGMPGKIETFSPIYLSSLLLHHYVDRHNRRESLNLTLMMDTGIIVVYVSCGNLKSFSIYTIKFLRMINSFLFFILTFYKFSFHTSFSRYISI